MWMSRHNMQLLFFFLISFFFLFLLRRLHLETAALHIEGTEVLSLQAMSLGNETSLCCWFDCVNISHC